MKGIVSTPADRDLQMRKQIFFALSSMEKRRDALTLLEMNGGRCASRQMFVLHSYDRPQRQIASEAETV